MNHLGSRIKAIIRCYCYNSFVKLSWKFQFALWVLIFISIGLYLLGKKIPQEAVESFVESFGVFAPVVYIIAHQLSYILAPISGLPFLIVGFYLFGPTTILYIYFASILGFTINYWIAKKWGRPFLSKFIGKEAMKKIDELAQTHGIITLIALRMLQGGIGDFVSYAYGLTQIRYKTFIILSALATIPGSILWYIVASKTNSIEAFLAYTWIFVILATIIFFGGNWLIAKLKTRS